MSEMEKKIKELEERIELLEDIIGNLYPNDLIEKEK